MNIFKVLAMGLCMSVCSILSAEQQLIVIRHGEADNNIEKVYNSSPDNANYKPVNLTDAGKQTVKKTANELLADGFNDNNIIAVFVSPLPRTQQTADILVQQGLVSKDKIHLDKRLIELNAGDLEGKPTLPVWKTSFSSEYNAESEEHVKARVKEFYESLVTQFPQGNIIVVTHGLPSQNLIEDATHQVVKLNPGEAKVVPLK